MENKKIPIRSYNKVWKIENKIYAIQNIVLPVPVDPKEVIYSILVAGVFFILSAVIPVFKHIPTVLRYLILPVIFSQFLLKKKLDGKMPQRYFVAWAKYMLSKNGYIERFIEHPGSNDGKVKINWICSMGL